VSTVAQRIEVSVSPSPTARRAHVLPASVVRSRVFGPTAYAVCASTKVTRVTRANGRSSGFHDTPWSVVSYSAVPPPAPTKARPRSGLVKTTSTGCAPPPPVDAAVPGTAVCLANVSPASAVRRTLPSRSSR
jgi:hypothetical protein